MNIDYNGLCLACSAIFSSEFEEIDKLKSMLQVSFEFLHADSITAYRYDRVTQSLELIAMPGVIQREVMRGPTPELIFQWENEQLKTPNLPEPIWIENKSEYKDHLAKLLGKPPPKTFIPYFRNRQLTKYPDGTDLSMAKVCLYKGIGQTEDRVGMLFFNFPKFEESKELTFNILLKQSIVYVSTLVREILIQELYHTEKRAITANTLLRDALNLLKMAEEHVAEEDDEEPIEKSIYFSKEHFTVAKKRELSLETRFNEIEEGKPYKKLLCKRKQILKNLLDNKSTTDSELEFNIIDEETKLLQICGHVCRAALGTCETFGGQADIIFVLGGNIGRRIEPQDTGGSRENEYFWLNPYSITNYCLETNKVFALNNIREKAHEDFRKRFGNEYGVQQYQSLIVVPILNTGPNQCVLRLMSSDRNCFLDQHTQAVQFTAFVAKHSLNMLTQSFMKRQAAQGLAFFAHGQAIGPQASTEDLLHEALKVLGADYAMFWFVPERPKELPFEGGIWVPPIKDDKDVPTDTCWLDTSPNIVRPYGMTHAIYKYAKSKKNADALFCIHILKGLSRENEDFPDYSFEVYTPKSGDNDDHVEFGSYSKNTQCNFPGIEKPASLSPEAGQHPHTQVGIAVSQHGSPSAISGVMWIGFDGLHELNWWEKAYLRGLSNYIAQGQAASGLNLILRSFNHSIQDLKEASDQIEENQESINSNISEAIEKSHIGWEMIDAKACEVKRMSSSSSRSEDGKIERLKNFRARTALRHAWSVANSLLILPDKFKATSSGKFKLDQCGNMTIAYGPYIDPDNDYVSGAIYAAAIQIFDNARRYGKPPFLAWVIEISPRIRIIFGNGGDPPSEDKLRIPEAQMSFNDPKHGIGLWFVRRLLHTEGGSIALRTKIEEMKFDCIPDIAYQCKAFYEITIEKGE